MFQTVLTGVLKVVHTIFTRLHQQHHPHHYHHHQQHHHQQHHHHHHLHHFQNYDDDHLDHGLTDGLGNKFTWQVYNWLSAPLSWYYQSHFSLCELHQELQNVKCFTQIKSFKPKLTQIYPPHWADTINPISLSGSSSFSPVPPSWYFRSYFSLCNLNHHHSYQALLNWPPFFLWNGHQRKWSATSNHHKKQHFIWGPLFPTLCRRRLVTFQWLLFPCCSQLVA